MTDEEWSNKCDSNSVIPFGLSLEEEMLVVPVKETFFGEVLEE